MEMLHTFRGTDAESTVSQGEAKRVGKAVVPCVFLTPWSRSVVEARRAVSGQGVQIHHANTMETARAILSTTGARVLLAEASFRDGNWEDALKLSMEFSRPVSVVVVTTAVDERFWITVMENGAYDLIPRPFASVEFARVVRNAHHHALVTPRTLRHGAVLL